MRRIFIILCVLFAVGSSAPQAQTARQLYISPVDGSGTDADPFHSRCLGMPGAGNSDLRPDIDGFFCASDTLPGDLNGVDVLGSSWSGNLGGKKGALIAKLGRPIKASTIDGFLVEILSPRLKPGRHGKIQIYLGDTTPVYEQTAWVPFRDYGLVSDMASAASTILEPTLAWAATISDNFTASDGDLDGCCTSAWSEFQGTAWAIVSNRAVATTNGTSIARNTVNNFSSVDHTATATLVSVTGGTAAGGTNTTCGVLIRKGADSVQTFYRTSVQISDAGELNQTVLQKNVAGVLTTLATDTTDWSANDTIMVSANGSTIEGQRSGGSLMSVTDTSITTGTNYGIRYFTDYTTGSPGCTLDTLTGSDIGVVTLQRREPIWFN